MSFKAFTMMHPEKDQFLRVEPTDDPALVFVRFKGACSHIMENISDIDTVLETDGHLYSLGYVELDPAGRLCPEIPPKS
jgi:hypothetical protein